MRYKWRHILNVLGILVCVCVCIVWYSIACVVIVCMYMYLYIAYKRIISLWRFTYDADWARSIAALEQPSPVVVVWSSTLPSIVVGRLYAWQQPSNYIRTQQPSCITMRCYVCRTQMQFKHFTSSSSSFLLLLFRMPHTTFWRLCKRHESLVLYLIRRSNEVVRVWHAVAQTVW